MSETQIQEDDGKIVECSVCGRMHVYGNAYIKTLMAEKKQLLELIKDIHRSKLLLMGIDWELDNDKELEPVVDLWDRIKQVYISYGGR